MKSENFFYKIKFSSLISQKFHHKRLNFQKNINVNLKKTSYACQKIVLAKYRLFNENPSLLKKKN